MSNIDLFFAEAQEALALDPALTYQRVVAAAHPDWVLEGKQTAFITDFAEFHQNHLPLPETQDISVLAVADQPQALLYTQGVEIHPVASLDASHAQQEGYADLAEWLAAKDLGTASMVVIESFRVLYPF